jgi:hypothetical protein
MADIHLFDIRESPIHGKGVFASRSLAKKDFVGMAMERVGRTGKADSDLRQTILARYLNHSGKPNSELVSVPGGFGLRTLCDLPAGTEILVDYADCERKVQPEALPPQEQADPDIGHADPRLRILKRIGGFSVVEVDGSAVRRTLDDNFTNFAHHYTLSAIPRDELWVDRGAKPEEIPIYISHMLTEYRLMASGMPYDKALDVADRAERADRAKGMFRRESAGVAPEHVKIRLFGTTPTGIKIWLVNGKAVRDMLDVDFTEGGHWLVYGWVPLKEIWIDNDVQPRERALVLLHEFYEARQMVKGLSYDKAHNKALNIEWRARWLLPDRPPFKRGHHANM